MKSRSKLETSWPKINSMTHESQNMYFTYQLLQLIIGENMPAKKIFEEVEAVTKGKEDIFALLCKHIHHKIKDEMNAIENVQKDIFPTKNEEAKGDSIITYVVYNKDKNMITGKYSSDLQIIPVTNNIDTNKPLYYHHQETYYGQSSCYYRKNV